MPSRKEIADAQPISIKQEEEKVELKFVGDITAGFPSPAEEELFENISLEEWLIRNPTSTFLVKVYGESMIEAGILPGDFVLVDRSLAPKNGDIVIAEVDGEWTMKYFRKQRGEILLVPANPRYPPIKPTESLNIFGVVIGVVRKYR
ncbi:LexA family transcriptional regulator [bacterium]|nr:LexA family transcriptional regulator [bacterium]